MRNNRKLESVANEYIDVIVNRKLSRLCEDCYHTLGWKTISSSSGITSVKLRLERNKKVKNRSELCKLQHECEDALIEIERLIKSRHKKAREMTWITLITASIFFIGSFIAYSFNFFPIAFLFALGFTGLGAACILYYKQIRKLGQNQIPELNSYYERIYHLCEKSEQLL
ncbi:hypothetical protein [Anaerocolumna jejuensis]|uniref:hypothetical protein n=1 Tax=Anaerocolumna jejuensis TaxID=259063 RepID=UPI003F7C422A